jgi:membrane protein insertase Oxa1/YidC/SpoIIIJ
MWNSLSVFVIQYFWLFIVLTILLIFALIGYKHDSFVKQEHIKDTTAAADAIKAKLANSQKSLKSTSLVMTKC